MHSSMERNRAQLPVRFQAEMLPKVDDIYVSHRWWVGVPQEDRSKGHWAEEAVWIRPLKYELHDAFENYSVSCVVWTWVLKQDHGERWHKNRLVQEGPSYCGTVFRLNCKKQKPRKGFKKGGIIKRYIF